MDSSSSYSSSSSTFLSGNRRPCFIEEDDGLASLADMEARYSGNNQNFLARSSLYHSRFRSNSLGRNVSSPRSVRFYDAGFEDHSPYFLDACFLCKKPLGNNRDIFMYRGDTAFCSEECRQEQIDIDEAVEKNRSLSSSMKALRKKDQRNKSSSSKVQDYSFITDPIAAA